MAESPPNIDGLSPEPNSYVVQVLKENARLKAENMGYEDFIVQDVIVQPRTILCRCERWQLPSGETVVAPLPDGIVGHFGAELKRFIISQCVQGQVTVPR
jgi:hypothetical protein